MNSDTIKSRFDIIAEGYDDLRRKFIPCFKDFYETTIDFLSKTIPEPRFILDLGAGTGLLSKYLFEYFPDSHYTLVDLSENMLDVARKRFKCSDNFEYIISDYSKNLPSSDFDLISSALSIHHLENEKKAVLYKNIYEKLPQNGTFINLDQFIPASEIMDQQYNSYWYEFIKSSGISSGDYEQMISRRELDRENTIEETISLLRSAGFKNVECIYSYMKFGVIFASKRFDNKC